jgi:hypothetical protein
MVYSDLEVILKDDCNCSVVSDKNHSNGNRSVIFENHSNGNVFPTTFHPDWEVMPEILAKICEELRLDPHPSLRWY